MILDVIEQHVVTISDIESQLFDHSWTTEQIRSHLNSGNPIWAFTGENKEIHGYLMVTEIAGEWEIYRIAVVPEWRRRGVAHTLISHLESLCKSGDSIFLEVKCTNISAIKLYENEGFVENGLRKGYYSDGTDAILMMKKV